MLFDLKFFKSLKLLSIIAKRHFRGEKIGHRRSPNRGSSAEFAEYKEYLPGDDLRFIDWNLYARLDRLYIKKFHNEEELNVSILLDASQSMAFGTPTKFDHARKIAAAIAYIALQHHDHARLYTFSQSLDPSSEGGFRRGHIHRLMGFLEKSAPAGRTPSFDEVITRFLLKNRRPGVVFLLTDALFGEDLYRGLQRLAHRRFETNLVQILSPEEMTPDLAGPLELVDAEDQSRVRLTINNQVLTLYEEVLRETIDELKGFLHRQGMRYHQSLTTAPFESTLLTLFEGAAGALPA
ncbi:MAG: hypothetical protein OZSIB_0631 [Candidatus Ozemobacter sibiricus]|jgi:uncharacterized protein (DUF58 family)|uniref:DUF58 domain-containing protein n=1 Tax=Candidatus Ozemobacter sibiricus TaxID=2268124 RepID=A0A367ZUH3_9BACT|nr:MAG: hypothetical protein OZSIB_0631 [Candidatus Ozemobacter sibiricus]